MKEITLILRFVVIGLIYVILFRLTKIMLSDLKVKISRDKTLEFALEVVASPDKSGITVGTIYPLSDKTTIGRSEKNQISINDPFVSSRHTEIYEADQKFYLKDLKSTNGTLLNGQKVDDDIEIIDDDRIEVGRVTFKVIG